MRTAVLLFLACFGVFGGLAHGYLENTDTLVTLQGATAWWHRGDPGLMSAEQAAAAPAGTVTWPLEHAVADFIRASSGGPPTFGRVGERGLHYVWFPLGHQALLVPCVALGEWFDARWPELEVESTRGDRRGVYGAGAWAQFFASFWSPLAASVTVVMLFLLARTLQAPHAGERRAVVVALIAAFCTQFAGGATETMSNVPGATMLCATVALIARHAAGSGGFGTMVAAGLCASAAVWLRYPLALALICVGAWAACAAWRNGRLRDLLGLVLGGAPGLGLLLWANAWRFGSPFETGYSNSAGFFEFPLWIGAYAILVAPGKGILWFSPLLWFVVPASFSRAARSLATAWVSVVFVVTWVLYATVVYWAAGQCWGIRYMSLPIVLLTTVVLAQTDAWSRAGWRRRGFVMLAVLGGFLSLGAHVAAYPGQQHLAFAAARAEYGAHLPNLDNNVNFAPHYSPLHSHWRYAMAALDGGLDERTSAATTERLFGVAIEGEVPFWADSDRGFRHLWMRWLDRLLPGFPAVWVALGWGIATALAWCSLWRRLRSGTR